LVVVIVWRDWRQAALTVSLLASKASSTGGMRPKMRERVALQHAGIHNPGR